MASNKSKNGKLLEESTIRRFMKLANLAPLSENFVQDKIEEEEEVEEVKTQNSSRSGGAPDRLDEMPEEDEMEMGAPEGEMDAPEEMPHAEPDGDEGGMAEPAVQDLVKAIADAIQAQTGVQVDVEGSAGEEEMEMGPEDEMPVGDEMGSEEEPMPEDDELMELLRRRLNEENSPVGAKASHSGNGSAEPKKTKPGDQGSVKDPDKGSVRVDGAEKPEKVGSAGYPHSYKAMEERLVRRVFERLVKDLKEARRKQLENVASPANVPAKNVAKPTVAESKKRRINEATEEHIEMINQVWNLLSSAEGLVDRMLNTDPWALKGPTGDDLDKIYDQLSVVLKLVKEYYYAHRKDNVKFSKESNQLGNVASPTVAESKKKVK